MASNPLREWSAALLVLGGILSAVALGLSVAQVLVGDVSERNYAFAALSVPGIGLALVPMAAGGALRFLSTPRRLARERG